MPQQEGHKRRTLDPEDPFQWHDPAHAATAFLTVIIMPLTYSIAYGLLAGIACWIFLQSLFKILSFFGIERPSFAPDDDDMANADESAFPKDTTKHSKEEGEDASAPKTNADDEVASGEESA